MFFDAGQFVVAAVKAWREAKRTQEWIKLTYGMVISGGVSYYGIKGLALLAGQSLSIAIGGGDLALALSVLGLFLHSPLTKGIMISIPQEIATKEIDSTQEQITRN